MTRQLAWFCLSGLACAAGTAAAEPPPPAALAQAAAADDAPQDLALAAACLERSEETAAVAYLARYVTAHPHQPLVRAQLAEMLWRHDRLAEARTHYEQFLSDAQLAPLAATQQVHAHTRLMAIAQRGGDAYAEHLNRGIGLYLIARQTAAEAPDAAEGMLCKAAGELTLAQRERPEEARPHWYLHLTWSRLGQSLPAARSLRAAAAANPAGLTPAERRDLALAAANEPRAK
jgi:hypothetical protein